MQGPHRSRIQNLFICGVSFLGDMPFFKRSKQPKQPVVSDDDPIGLTDEEWEAALERVMHPLVFCWTHTR